MATRCIESAVINSSEDIFTIPDEANCIATKHGRCIFAYATDLPEKYTPRPEGAVRISLPGYRKHGDRFIDYGKYNFIFE